MFRYFNSTALLGISIYRYYNTAKDARRDVHENVVGSEAHVFTTVFHVKYSMYL
jgi:hypothetical protein